MPMTKHPCRVAALGATALITALLVSGCSLQPDVSTRVQPNSRTAQAGAAAVGQLADRRRTSTSPPCAATPWWSTSGRRGAARAARSRPSSTALVTRYAARGVQFLGVDIRDDAANARAYVQEFRVTYPSVFDPASEDAATFNVDAPPTTLVIDASGTIRLRELGTLTDVPATLDSLLGAAPEHGHRHRTAGPGHAPVATPATAPPLRTLLGRFWHEYTRMRTAIYFLIGILLHRPHRHLRAPGVHLGVAEGRPSSSPPTRTSTTSPPTSACR